MGILHSRGNSDEIEERGRKKVIKSHLIFAIKFEEKKIYGKLYLLSKHYSTFPKYCHFASSLPTRNETLCVIDANRGSHMGILLHSRENPSCCPNEKRASLEKHQTKERGEKESKPTKTMQRE
jgi:hypothetical protein